MIRKEALMSIIFPFVLDPPPTQLHPDQTAKSTLTIQENGDVLLTCLYKNGRKVDGDHFVTLVVLMATGGKPLAVLKDVQGVNPTYFGRTNESRGEVRGTLPPEVLKSFAGAVMEHSHWDKYNDLEIWRPVREIGKAFLETWLSDKNQRNLQII
jgi:hypothetical protein